MIPRNRECPRCGTVHAPTAVRCGCGYTFTVTRQTDSPARRGWTAPDSVPTPSGRLLEEARAALLAATGQLVDAPAGAPTPGTTAAAQTPGSPRRSVPRRSAPERSAVAQPPAQHTEKKESRAKPTSPSATKIRAPHPAALQAPDNRAPPPTAEHPFQPHSDSSHKTEPDSRPESPVRATKECPHCTAAVASGTAKCRCGFIFVGNHELPELTLGPDDLSSLFGPTENLKRE